MLPLLARESFIEIVFRFPLAGACTQKAGLDDLPCEFFKRHAVVLEKARYADGRGGEDAKPTRRLVSENVMQAEVDTEGRCDGKRAAYKLTQGEAEENTFLMTANFLVDLDFHVFLHKRGNASQIETHFDKAL